MDNKRKIIECLEKTRKELLDLGMRNSLLNFRTKTKRIDAVDEISREIYRILVTENKKMSFIPATAKMIKKSEMNENESADDLILEMDFDDDDDINENGLAARHIDTKLQTLYTKEKLYRQLLTIHNNAKIFIEEQGVNILYLALGFLNWYEADSSEKERKAPLILIPVELIRGTAREKFKLRYSGEDVGTNMSLAAKLKSDFNIEFPICDEESIDVDAYFEVVNEAIQGMDRWNISKDEMVLGFFSFGKFLMYKDLDSEQWPEGNGPGDNDILGALLLDGFREKEFKYSDADHLDSILKPENMLHVVDADGSQAMAILEVNSGRNMVIQGPPGTGKSQTITNIIAESVGLGKKVLFVSEKMAALEVVKRRLDSVDLGDAVIELHSHNTRKRNFLDEIKRTLELGKPKDVSIEDDINEYNILRKRLNDYSFAVNEPVLESGFSFYHILGNYLKHSNQLKVLLKFEPDKLKNLSNSDFREQRSLLEEVEEHIKEYGNPVANPFWGSKLITFLPTDEIRLKDKFNAVKLALKSIEDLSKNISTILGIDFPVNLRSVDLFLQTLEKICNLDWKKGMKIDIEYFSDYSTKMLKAIEEGRNYSKKYNKYSKRVIPDAWNSDLMDVRENFIMNGKKWWRSFSGNYRRAKSKLAGLCKKSLPDSYDGCLRLIDAILAAQKAKHFISENEDKCRRVFHRFWEDENSDWDLITNIFETYTNICDYYDKRIFSETIISYINSCDDFNDLIKQYDELNEGFIKIKNDLKEIYNCLEMDIDTVFNDDDVKIMCMNFEKLNNHISLWDENTRELYPLINYSMINQNLELCELNEVPILLKNWSQVGKRLVHAFEASWYTGLLNYALTTREPLKMFNRNSHELAIKKFKALDKLLIKYNRHKLIKQHWDNIPTFSQGGELADLKKEMNKKRKIKPIRKLIKDTGRALQAIKPVFMMSPMSIAKYLSPGSITFDIVIFDEASQVKPVDALGAIIRSRQAIVVGDSKQLPPSAFFDSLTGAVDDENEEFSTSDVESILSLFAAQNAPERMLQWHYRSRHESLIAVSNHEFYDNKLMIFPSPGSLLKNLGLQFKFIPDTVYDRGKSRTNKLEALAVAEYVIKHAREHPDLSIGAVAFSVVQRDAIELQLEMLRRKTPELESFFTSHEYEPFFVKNLENVQGDERDVILISIGYGKSADGYMTMSFGPLTREGGERRLNVLISRAKQSCIVFANFNADDIDLNRTKSVGVAALKTFLTYAETRRLTMSESTGLEPDSPFEEEVICELKKKGYDVVPQVGCGGFRIDIGIKDSEKKGRYLLGIECDGAMYHSARTARDRDRLRQDVLEGLGWKIHRIWSTDWFRDPARELEKIDTAIENAKIEMDIQSEKIRTDEEKTEFIVRDENIVSENSDKLEYRLADFQIYTGNKQLHELSMPELSQYIKDIVEIESPVHEDEVIKRITEFAGLKKAGKRIRSSIINAVQYTAQKEEIVVKNKFYWSPEMNIPEIRDRSNLKASSRKLELIAPEELRLSLIEIVENAFSISKDDAISSSLSAFGIKRVTATNQEILSFLISEMVNANELIEENGVLKKYVI